MKLKLFRVELIFRLTNLKYSVQNKFDRKLRFIEATTEREAYQNAIISATQELEELNNHLSTNSQWEFIGLETFQNIKEKVSEREFFYTFKNDREAFEYIKQLRFKSDTIQTQIALTA